MAEHPDVTFSKNNRSKAIEIIPAQLKVREEKFFNKIKKSKRSLTEKLLNIYEFMDSISSSFNHLTPCKKGCSHCCEIRVDISELELSIIKSKARKEFNSARKGLKIGQPCPFLKDNKCSIYDVRPFLCRRHQVFTPTNQLCINNNELGQELLSFSEIERSYAFVLAQSGFEKPKDIRKYFI